MTHSAEDSDFTIRNRKEIIFILDDLAKQRPALTLTAKDGTSTLTAVLGVDVDDNCVYFDIGPSEKTNEHILNSEDLRFSTQTGVRVRWHAAGITLVELQDGMAFSIEIPEEIVRIQRREYFRLSTPRGDKGLICKIQLGETGVMNVPVVDMSVGGVGLSLRGEIPPAFQKGSVLQGCSIEFPAVGAVSFSLKVCGIFSSNKTASGEQVHHLGTEFVSLGRGASNVVQRYMIQLESERIHVG